MQSLSKRGLVVSNVPAPNSLKANGGHAAGLAACTARKMAGDTQHLYHMLRGNLLDFRNDTGYYKAVARTLYNLALIVKRYVSTVACFYTVGRFVHIFFTGIVI